MERKTQRQVHRTAAPRQNLRFFQDADQSFWCTLSRGNRNLAMPNLLKAGTPFTFQAILKSSCNIAGSRLDKSTCCPLNIANRNRKSIAPLLNFPLFFSRLFACFAGPILLSYARQTRETSRTEPWESRPITLFVEMRRCAVGVQTRIAAAGTKYSGCPKY
jgi:hypothetical protein